MGAKAGPAGTATAHDGPLVVGPLAVRSRAEREAAEAAELSTGATRSVDAGHRACPEEADPWRTCFERDRDRILHSPAFRRLAGKTQVVVFPADHQRTRLTHALEVAQIAVALARALRLNEALAEAIALGHDCGHGPGGHASEAALSGYLPNGFDHAEWGADVVLAPLNLCAETLDGVRNHSWSRPTPATPEGEIVAWADRIAYVCHDFEDAAATGIVAVADLPREVVEVCGDRREAQIDRFVRGVVAGAASSGYVAMDAEGADALAAFRQFDYERIYLRPASVAQAERVVRLLQALVEHLVDHPERLPDAPANGDVPHAAVRFVAGMTDRYACRCARRWLGWRHDELPTGIDLG
jgi:dGTPase